MKIFPVGLLALLTLCGCDTSQQIQLQRVSYGIPAPRPGTYEPSQVTALPVPIKQSAPKYPFELRKTGVAGEADIFYIIRSDGRVGDVAIVKANDLRLGRAAANAIAQWRFRPAELDGVAVNCRMITPIVFTFND